MGERRSSYDRVNNDWYIEPDWCVDLLRENVNLRDGIHDPCAGIGTIVNNFIEAGIWATGSDIVNRGAGFDVQDYLTDPTVRRNIVTNPPYKLTEKIVRHALAHTEHRVCVLVPLNFLAGQKRHSFYIDTPVEKIVILSRRPSMPPGEMLVQHGEEYRKNGSIDFCWIVWNNQYEGGPTMTWAK